MPKWILSLREHHADNYRYDNGDNDGHHNGHNVLPDGDTNGDAVRSAVCRSNTLSHGCTKRGTECCSYGSHSGANSRAVCYPDCCTYGCAKHFAFIVAYRSPVSSPISIANRGTVRGAHPGTYRSTERHTNGCA